MTVTALRGRIVGFRDDPFLQPPSACLQYEPDGLVRSASYWVWALYGNHLGPIALPVETSGPTRETDVRLGDTPVDGVFRTRHERLPAYSYIDPSPSTPPNLPRKLHSIACFLRSYY